MVDFDLLALLYATYVLESTSKTWETGLQVQTCRFKHVLYCSKHKSTDTSLSIQYIFFNPKVKLCTESYKVGFMCGTLHSKISGLFKSNHHQPF